jgi:hypothetical protein
VGLFTPAIAKSAFSKLAGLSAFNALKAEISTPARFLGGDVSLLTRNQLGYVAGGSVFSVGIDRLQHAAFSSFNNQTMTASGYGSSGSVYTSFVPPCAHSACGTLCR